ncbi:hypothetical protein SAMN05216249_106145 [Acetitomaculum ruminis DSM 5522]|uniref:Uncharacterized protein n=2 Tax=Acetitomaculum ruminis TaxID=2382 RepID=A0A1I0XIX7_9FIRM|nr:hypothetical protein SAMN05216249_106145 [Acetitomaculum ruminis DSM 5522]
MVFYKSGSLLPCIITHSMIDAFSMFGADNAVVDQIYVVTTIVVAIVYCIYLGRIKEDAIKNENGSIPDSGIHTDIGDKGGDK